MANYISGRSALKMLDASIARTRTRLANAVEAADAQSARRAALNAEQVSTYRNLAALRLDHLATGDDNDRLLKIEDQALSLIRDHEAFVVDEAKKLGDAANDIQKLEDQRAVIAEDLDAAIETYEAKVAQIERELDSSPDYMALKAAFAEAEAISERAHSKQALAEQDRAQKGAPYDNDPLFSYLWQRRYGTPAYKAGSFIRSLDNWVARICRYEGARQNYHRLTELPVRLAEHADKTDTLCAHAEAALEAAELKALADGGANALKEAADALRNRTASHDELIRLAEAEHREIASSHAKAEASQTGPAAEARKLLEDALQKATFPDLRILASQTTARDDDALVDKLVQLRAEELDLEMSQRSVNQRPIELEADLKAIEDFRRGFKSANFDSSYAEIRAASVDAAISALVTGQDSPRSALKRIQSGLRRRNTRVDPGFGGRRRSDTLGLPDILGDIAIEMAREASRRSGTGYRRRSSRTSWPSSPSRTSFPTGSRTRGKGGGFKTGGGF